jgi:UDP-hydrolysing UDP-N-acetyl-D-glucosamine 2-epimerase
MVCSAHLSPEFGLTVREIERDGFEPAERIEMLLSSDSPTGTAKSMALVTAGFAETYARRRPDILLVSGDRFETHAAVTAALPFRIPVAHIHGGESSEGAMDELLRHSITKLSHLHFASTPLHAGRIIQMGEEEWRVTVSGAPSLDNLQTMRLLGRRELAGRYGLNPDRDFLVATYHPATLEERNARSQITQLLAALETCAMPVVFTCPGADHGSREVIAAIRTRAQANPNMHLVPNLGTRGYFSLMRHASAMVGNSSSGIIEAASFKLPVVNVGSRQRGRMHGANVLDVPCRKQALADAIRKALSPGFRASLAGLVNPYGDGRAAERIIERLKTVTINENLLMKRFCDLQAAPASRPGGSRRE